MTAPMTSDEKPSESRPLSGCVEFAAAALELVAGAHRQLDLLSYGLDKTRYGTEEFVEAVRKILLSSDSARMRILLNQPRLAVSRSHLLVETGRRLTSRVEFRELPPERLDSHCGELLIADRRSLLEQRSNDDITAMLRINAPGMVKPLAEEFDRLWEESPPAQELRELGL